MESTVRLGDVLTDHPNEELFNKVLDRFLHADLSLRKLRDKLYYLKSESNHIPIDFMLDQLDQILEGYPDQQSTDTQTD